MNQGLWHTKARMLLNRRHLPSLLLILFPLLCCVSVWADGKVFSRAVAAAVKVPDQRAMLHFSKGVERLVIETSFIGEGTNFAWVVPLPSAPKIEAVSTNFFQRLSVAFQPKLIHKPEPWWFLFAVFGIIISSVIRTNQESVALGCLWRAGLLFLVMLVGCPIVFGPGGCGPPATSPQANAVTVLERQTVGVYDTVILSGQNGRELANWLNQSGFYTPTSTLPVISSYATQGWVFAAARIHRETANQPNSRPHPLAFTFASAKPVYPLRLTGIENDSCSIELFVFGPERAEAAGFRVEHCGTPFGVEDEPSERLEKRSELFALPHPGEYRIRAPEVRNVALPAAVTTKLVGKLGPKEMRSDAWINWVPFQPKLPVLHSEGAAASAFFNWFLGIGIPGALLLQAVGRKLSERALLKVIAGVLTLAILCGVVRLQSLTTTRVKMVPVNWSMMSDWKGLDEALARFALTREYSGPLTFDELQSALDKYLAHEAKNVFTGEPLKSDTSPGNVTLRSSGEGVEVMWHDIEGAGHRLATFKHRVE